MAVTKALKKNLMDIRIASTRQEMGRMAASDVAAELRRLLREQPAVRMIFAAAPSQREMLQALVEEPDIDWGRVTAFHMDEYIGLAADAPQRFGRWLREAVFDRVPLAGYRLIEPDDDPETTCRTYAEMLGEAPIDVVCLGIGANGHLAFNDPPADLDDPLSAKVVDLDDVCRQQQVDDACFAAFDDVPRRAVTLTVPMLMSGRRLFCCVPGSTKSAAVRRTVHDPLSGACPATALRQHPQCTVYLDKDSSADL